MDPLDKKLSEHYQQQTLNSARLESILEASHRQRQHRRMPVYAAVAGLLLTIAVIMHQRALSNQQVDYALREAALNHLKKLQFDAQAQTVAVLQNGLHELPFSLVLPEELLSRELDLIGGRYCTLGGNLAAHLKFAHPDSGEQISLFMTPGTTDNERLAGNAKNVEGVDVKLWQEEKVLYAMARTTAD